MNEETEKPIINFKLHLILIILTGTLWVPFYYLICFSKLNELAESKSMNEDVSTKNNPIVYFLLTLTVLGAPFVLYRKYQLLRNYVASLGPFRNPPAKKRDKENIDESKHLNCIEPKSIVGFAIADFFIIASAVTTTTLSILHLVVNPSWTSDAFMVMFPIALATFVLSVTFAVRVIKEEGYWVQVLTSVIK